MFTHMLKREKRRFEKGKALASSWRLLRRSRSWRRVGKNITTSLKIQPRLSRAAIQGKSCACWLGLKLIRWKPNRWICRSLAVQDLSCLSG